MAGPRPSTAKNHPPTGAGGPDPPNGAARCCSQRPRLAPPDNFSTATKAWRAPPGRPRILVGAVAVLLLAGLLAAPHRDWAQDEHDRHRKSRAQADQWVGCAQRPDDYRRVTAGPTDGNITASDPTLSTPRPPYAATAGREHSRASALQHSDRISSAARNDARRQRSHPRPRLRPLGRSRAVRRGPVVPRPETAQLPCVGANGSAEHIAPRRSCSHRVRQPQGDLGRRNGRRA